MPRVVALIPARFASSRYPGKPLVEIAGVPMVVRVARNTIAALGSDVYVATDDERIAAVVREAGIPVVMTSSAAPTGTDRLAEAAEQLDADLYVNVQGDEPMLDPRSLTAVIAAAIAMPGVVINAMARVGADEDVRSPNLPKVVTTSSGRLVYMSRAPVPATKPDAPTPAYWKQVCIYAVTREHLRAYAARGRVAAMEVAEDIEILRFLELGIPVHMVEVAAGSLAVDEPSDVPRVEAALRALGWP